MSSQFEGKRHIPFTATAEEKRHGRDTRWVLRAKEAPDHIKQAWPGSAWIVELITTKTEVGAFYWTVPAPDIVNSGREEQGSISV